MERDQRDGSGVKSIGCPAKGPEFSPQKLHDGWQLSDSSPEELLLASSGTTNAWYTDRKCRKNADKKILKWFLKVYERII